MPNRTTYQGLSLAEALRQLAELHHQPRTRHISVDEKDLLLKAADQLDHYHPSISAFN